MSIGLFALSISKKASIGANRWLLSSPAKSGTSEIRLIILYQAADRYSQQVKSIFRKIPLKATT